VPKTRNYNVRRGSQNLRRSRIHVLPRHPTFTQPCKGWVYQTVQFLPEFSSLILCSFLLIRVLVSGHTSISDSGRSLPYLLPARSGTHFGPCLDCLHFLHCAHVVADIVLSLLDPRCSTAPFGIELALCIYCQGRPAPRIAGSECQSTGNAIYASPLHSSTQQRAEGSIEPSSPPSSRQYVD
jgi:hypothetical protein